MIKKFNEYNNGIGDDQYYKEISEEEYNKSSTKMWDDGELSNPTPIDYLDFTEKEVDKVRSLFTKYEPFFNTLYNVDIEYELPSYISSYVFTEPTKKFHKYELDIKKMNDDWYYVSKKIGLRHHGGTFKFYKCDGFQGVIRLLKNILN